MVEILTGFAVIALAVLAGYLAVRLGILTVSAGPVLTRLNFNILMPPLLFSVLATADVGALFSSLLPVSAIAAVTMMVVSALVSKLVWRHDLGHTVVGALCASYLNANNIGIPIAIYMLGDGAYAAPILLLQLMVFMPVALGLLDVGSSGRVSLPRLLRTTFTNPLIVGSLLGLLVAVLGVELPPIVLEPLSSLGHAAVPIILISLGISMAGQRVLEPGTGRRAVAVATLLKLVAMPAVAYLVGRFGFGLDGHALYAVTVLAALPTAQNVFVYAQQYRVAEVLARDAVFVTTIGALPVLFGISLLLG